MGQRHTERQEAQEVMACDSQWAVAKQKRRVCCNQQDGKAQCQQVLVCGVSVCCDHFPDLFFVFLVCKTCLWGGAWPQTGGEAKLLCCGAFGSQARCQRLATYAVPHTCLRVGLGPNKLKVYCAGPSARTHVADSSRHSWCHILAWGVGLAPTGGS